MGREGLKLNGKKIRVNPSVKRRSKAEHDANSNVIGGKRPNELYISNISPITTTDSLYSKIAEIVPEDQISRVHVVMNTETEKNRGFGYASFETKESMTKVQQALNDVVVEGRAISVVVSEPGNKSKFKKHFLKRLFGVKNKHGATLGGRIKAPSNPYL